MVEKLTAILNNTVKPVAQLQGALFRQPVWHRWPCPEHIMANPKPNPNPNTNPNPNPNTDPNTNPNPKP